MLTADLVRARKRGDKLELLALDAKSRAEVTRLAGQLLDLTQASLGATRGEYRELCAQLRVRAKLRKLMLGLRKLVEDRCEFEVKSARDPGVLRRELFTAASAALRRLEPGVAFDRGVWLEHQASQRNLSSTELEQALYADLRSEQVLRHFERTTPEHLVREYEAAQAQSVLLRAVRVTVQVQCRDAYAYRTLFRKLKFLRLLHRIEPAPTGGYKIDIDGPFSMFSSVTKYGLQLALALPSVQACDRWSLTADVRWGQQRVPLSFLLRGGASTESAAPPLPDEVQTLLKRFAALGSLWEAKVCNELLELPGVGTVAPDLVFVHRVQGHKAYLEVLGYWSRDAVWRRVELVQQGLPDVILFAVSSRLRVSEEVLDRELPGELYVYKASLSAREILSRLERRFGEASEQLSLAHNGKD